MLDHGFLREPASTKKGEKFAHVVRDMRIKKRFTQADLAEKIQGSKTTICRLEQDSNGRGGPFACNPKLVAALCIALCDTVEECKHLIYAAYPYFSYLFEQNLNNMLTGDPMQKNEILADLCGQSVFGALQAEKEEKDDMGI